MTGKLGLLLIHPAVTTMPEMVVAVKEQAKRDNVSIIDQFLVNKVVDGSVNLKAGKYDIIRYLTPEKLEEIKFPKMLIAVLQESLKDDGLLYGLSDQYKVDALLNGFEIVSGDGDVGEYHWIKKPAVANATVGIVPLKGKSNTTGAKPAALPSFKKKTTGSTSALPSFKRAAKTPVPVSSPKVGVEEEEDFGDLEEDDLFSESAKARFLDGNDEDDDESIDEDELVTDKSGKITFITCGKSKTKRKKACKDCSCGIKEEEEEEIDNVRTQQDKVIKFTEDELTEVDFTIDGKKIGGCGSCSLGDAFRCSGCPYLGLPAFKPGQAINLNAISDDL
ncbi:electron carrier DRE2 KNAG_0C06360 [Huiozyma naganishii CBS 8797]|uniref:Uncharacterized protein n=1 Tax=Huiozyma naganishii (strain ATCC MYA-139 / BCRC 22969 / CBS 8797 / KCTC 17520 / NBRC 10181 / NCYC 3082 / Yp74L-3) TaxID=1071383 RepID=J7S587_HUIN7|nr:hypothetical protein KNAG_0C06360 [Kazachstania naganishii CBS 8797]CCK69729.1 hypothetical protein KNAG_0C06360 [Kazachstania naganishii CBS 8797]